MKTTAIIAKDHRDFKEFVKGLDSVGFYIFVDSIEKTRGVEFSEIYTTENVDQFSSKNLELIKASQLRVMIK